MTRIYLDNHATTPVDPRVLEAMLPYFTEKFGNPASRNHSFGWEAEDAVERSREQVAALIGAETKEIVFTSGATEADNLAIKGAVKPGDHVVTMSTEHKAVLDTCKALEGVDVTYLPPTRSGILDLAEFIPALRENTRLVSIMHANNEIGVLQPIEEIGGVCAARNILFHTDAAQSAGKVPLDVRAMNVHLASISAHKLYGPKGVGALYVRKRNPRVKLKPLIDGGGHERGFRSGTLPTPLIVGFGRACEIARAEMDAEAVRLRALRDKLWHGLRDQLDFVFLNGAEELRLPGNLNVVFGFVEGETLMMQLKDVAVSSGAACSSAALEPSHVLKAIGVAEDLAHSSIRFGLGRFTTEAEIDEVLRQIVPVVRKLRALSPLYDAARKGDKPLASIEWKRD